MGDLRHVVVGLLERRHPSRWRGSLVTDLVPALERRGAAVRLVHAEEGVHRIDRPPAWDVTVLKSGSAAALHLAAAAAGFGIPSVNDPEATRLAQDRLAVAAVLIPAGLPMPGARVAWLGKGALHSAAAIAGHGPLLVKAARGSGGGGLWPVEPGQLPRAARGLPPGPYLLMDRLPRHGDDLKVFVAGGWMRAIRRVFPAISLSDKRGRPAAIEPEVEAAARLVGELLGLSCYGVDFIATPEGWRLVDVNAFPGYKGAGGAAEAIAEAIAEALAGRVQEAG